MRVAVAAAFSSLAVIAPGDRAGATFSGNTLTLTLHYLMTCGQPGAGPLVIALPAAFRISSLRVTVSGKTAPAGARGTTVTVQLPRPPQVTCMSIAEGTLPVTVSRLRASAGRYTVSARIRNHAFSAQLRIR